MPLRPSSIINFATAFVVLVCLTFMGLSGWRLWETRQSALEQARAIGANLARSMGQYAEDKFKEADTLLASLVDRIEQGGGMAGLNEASIHRFLRDIVAELPQLHGVFVYDAQGALAAHSQAALQREYSSAEPGALSHHRDSPGRRSFLGTPVRSPSTGEWLMMLSRRVQLADGAFDGLVLVTLRMQHFVNYYARFSLGDKGMVSLFLDGDTLLARYPLNQAHIGRRDSLPTAPAQSGAMGVHPLGMEMWLSLDNAGQDTYLHSFQDSYRYPLFVVVSQSTEEVLAPWRREARQHGLVLLALVLLAGTAGGHLLHQIRRRARGEHALQRAQQALEQANQELSVLASEDGLTKLANRRRMDAVLDEEHRRARRTHLPLSALLVDIDYFKRFNDHYGHQEGDVCLQQAARLLEQTCCQRAGDFVARYGGEEFVVLLPNTDEHAAILLAERARAAVAAAGFIHAQSPFRVVTVSVGVAVFDVQLQPAQPPSTLVAQADAALYHAKAAGRNRVAAYTAQMNAQLAARGVSADSEEVGTDGSSGAGGL